MANLLNRFAFIFYHYAAAIWGVRQRLWPSERPYGRLAILVAVAVVGWGWSVLLDSTTPRLVRLGLLLVLFSPQWCYIVPLEHPVFEFRAYGAAAGSALILSSFLEPATIMLLTAIWTVLTIRRRRIIVEPLSFWQRAQEENRNGSKLRR